ncbi:acyl carrier protein [Kitasatospora sp. NPDC058063]|uniref:acyl carrier protein n=1 Tax=unclassified Kitasatospora TaxID=2633591 RepID=UPI0036DB9C49
MVDTTDILNAVLAIVEEILGIDPSEVSAETSFTDDLDVDSLAMVEITVAVEDRFELKIPDNRTAELRTIGDVVGYVADPR